MSMRVIYNWETPVSKIPAQEGAGVSILKKTINATETLSMSDDYSDRVIFGEDTEFTVLQDNSDNSVWMSDTPKEYYSMAELVTRTKGPKVIVGGLGLGLLVHLLALRRDITSIIVVEENSEVIGMVSPYLPKYHGLTIEVINDDFFEVIYDRSHCDADTVIVDIWKDNSEDNRELFESAELALEDEMPDINHLFWAFQTERDKYSVDLYMTFMTIKERKERKEREAQVITKVVKE